jgi:hypothetical protein
MLVAFGTLPALIFSVIMVLALATTDSDVVKTRADQRSIDLGRPFVWLHQDQSVYDPPLPTHLGLSSPWESPTNLSGTGLLLNVMVVFASTAIVVTLLWALALPLVRILRRARRV